MDSTMEDRRDGEGGRPELLVSQPKKRGKSVKKMGMSYNLIRGGIFRPVGTC